MAMPRIQDSANSASRCSANDRSSPSPAGPVSVFRYTVGNYEREEWVDSVVVAPSERAIVDVAFDEAGTFELRHATPGREYTLAHVVVDEPICTERVDDLCREVVSHDDLADALDGHDPDLSHSAAARLQAAPTRRDPS